MWGGLPGASPPHFSNVSAKIFLLYICEYFSYAYMFPENLADSMEHLLNLPLINDVEYLSDLCIIQVVCHIWQTV
jgi:hypothetical protein